MVVLLCLACNRHLYAPWDMMSLEDSLCYFNNSLAGNYVIGGLKPSLNLVMAHWPRPSHVFHKAGSLWLLKIKWGSGDKYNRCPGSSRVKGAHVAV